MTEKVIGYSLLVVGILIIVFSAVNMVFVFTGRADPVQLFHFTGISLDMSKMLSAQLPAQLAGTVQTTAAPTEIVPGDMLNQISNLTAHIFLMGFLISVGQKLASLGIELLRPVTIKVKGRDDIPAEKD